MKTLNLSNGNFSFDQKFRNGAKWRGKLRITQPDYACSQKRVACKLKWIFKRISKTKTFRLLLANLTTNVKWQNDLIPSIWQYQYGRRENASYRVNLLIYVTYLPINKEVWYRVSLLIAIWIRRLLGEHVHMFLTCQSSFLGTCSSGWQTPSGESEFLCFEIKFSR